VPREAQYAGLAALFVALFLFRIATASLTNDDYLHVSTAQQVLLGGVPVRDFLDPGEPLFYTASAAAQLLLGRSMLSEVLLDACLLSLGQVLVFVLASRAARSSAVGALAALFPIVLVSRLYSYPKTFLYAVALILAWRYLDTRRREVLWGLSLCTGVAFLFRHDHGAYIGVMAVAAMAMAHGRDRAAWRCALADFGVPILLVVVPFLVFVQLNGGVGFYVRGMLDTARGEYERTVSQIPVFRLVENGLVDTLAPGPPGEADPNVTAWLYWVTVALPPLTLLVLAGDWMRRRRGVALAWRGMDREAAKVTCAALLAVLMHTFLLRAKSESAVADVSALTAVLGAWLLARALAAGRHAALELSRQPRPWARAGVGVAAFVAAAGIYAATARAVLATPGGDLAAMFVRTVVVDQRNQLAEAVGKLRAMTPPYPDEGARYVFACTAESDRVLITSGYRPELYYAAGRGFAAGRLYYLNSLAPSPEFKAFSLDRLRAERVPVALVEPEDSEFAEQFEGLHDYVRRHYRHAGHLTFLDVRFDVLVDARITPARTWAHGLPCYR
jgi:hypothetical protein